MSHAGEAGIKGGQIVLSQAAFDLAGRVTSETNALNGVTTYVESVNNNGQKIVTTTYPDGGTRIETYFLDGTLALQANAAYQLNAAGTRGQNAVAGVARAKLNF